MGMLSVNCLFPVASSAQLNWRSSTFMSGEFICLYGVQKILPFGLCSKWILDTRAFAKRKPVKKLKDDMQANKSLVQRIKRSQLDESILETNESFGGDDDAKYSDKDSTNVSRTGQMLTGIPSRSAVLQACTLTCGLIAALGIIIRQVSHLASMEGLPIHDCTKEVTFSLETWHLELIVGLVILISSSRYLLLETWPDFAESSEAANRQVLTSLEPLDYLVVALLPGVSEELLFRGALLPLFGDDGKSILIVAAIFGILHLGGGRKYSFALWATFVGIAYGCATILSSSVVVPMISHALNNLVGGLLWRNKSPE